MNSLWILGHKVCVIVSYINKSISGVLIDYHLPGKVDELK